jgi:hypothetical protein
MDAASAEMSEQLWIRTNLEKGCVQGLINMAIYKKMLELQVDDFFFGANDQLMVS